MKRFAIILLFGLLTNFMAHAKKVDGVIIDNNDSTIHVKFDIPVNIFSGEVNFESIQQKVKYIDKNNKLVIVKPDQVKEIIIKGRYEVIRMMSINYDFESGSISNTKIFLHILVDGKLRLFRHYSTVTIGGSTIFSSAYRFDRFILQKSNQKLKQPKGVSFYKDMAEYFSDCPELARKIERKEYSKEDMEEIAKYYNQNCSK